MAERFTPGADRRLEERLVELREDLVYPPTPDLATAIRERLAGEGPPRRRSIRTMARSRWGWLAVAALTLLVLAVSVLALSPDVRTAVAERLGLRGVGIIQIPFMPPVPPTSATSAPAASVPSPGGNLGLGERVADLAEARGRVPYQMLAPTLPELGLPDEVYLADSPAGPQVSLVYRARAGLPAAAETGAGLLVTQFQADFEPSFLKKVVGPDARLEEVRVNRGPAYWIEGRPHLLVSRSRSGSNYEERTRLAGNVLLWERGELTLRIEGNVSRDEAVRIADSMR